MKREIEQFRAAVGTVEERLASVRRTPEPGRCVYFIRETGTNYVKIGWTSGSPWLRVKQLQVGNPRDLCLEAVLHDRGPVAEADLHRMWVLRALRGEWFEATTGEVVELVSRVSAEWPAPMDTFATVPADAIRAKIAALESMIEGAAG